MIVTMASINLIGVVLVSFVAIAGHNIAEAAVSRKVLLNRQIARAHGRSLFSRARLFGEPAANMDGKRARWTEEKQKVFQPSTTSCCKLGYKAARKGLACSTSMSPTERMYSAFLSEGVSTKDKNYQVPDHVDKLSYNIDTCIEESFHANFKKCCQLKTDYKQAMQMCRRFRGANKGMRRTCRDKVRERYRM